MNGYTRTNWTCPIIYDKNKTGFAITDKTFDEAISIVKKILGNDYRITNADNERASFTFKRYADGRGICGKIDENSGITWVCNNSQH